ncbi:MAG: carbohydrate kinase [Bacteroidales bacterium]|nr:carbohydrate kinase [Bacteroidales bacterium]MEA4840638.1 carbohydrate kinase [Bacteroidales bacterium]
MRKIIGIGETILDVIFKNDQPNVAVPGGSIFNGMISLGRLDVPALFISETGNDKIGRIVKDFMKDSNLTTEFINTFPDGKSPVSLAFLNDHNDAEYLFYKDYPSQRLDMVFPRIEADDILIFGSFYALNPQLRPAMMDLLQEANDRKAIVFYDINFRKTHADEAIRLSATFIENFEFADIIRGSEEDFRYLYNLTDPAKIYKDKIKFYTPYFIYTAAEKGVDVWGENFSKHYDVKPIKTVSTVGAGDSFNAGVLFGLLRGRIRRQDLPTLTERDWDSIIQCGLDFSAEVCQSYDNYISKEFAKNYLR